MCMHVCPVIVYSLRTSTKKMDTFWSFRNYRVSYFENCWFIQRQKSLNDYAEWSFVGIVRLVFKKKIVTDTDFNFLQLFYFKIMLLTTQHKMINGCVYWDLYIFSILTLVCILDFLSFIFKRAHDTNIIPILY